MIIRPLQSRLCGNLNFHLQFQTKVTNGVILKSAFCVSMREKSHQLAPTVYFFLFQKVYY